MREKGTANLAYVNAELRGRALTALVDGGAAATLAKERVLQGLKVPCEKGSTPRLVGVTGNEIKTVGQATLHMNFGGVIVPLRAIVVQEDQLPADVLVGKDEMLRHGIYDRNDHVEIRKKKIPLLKKVEEHTIAMVLQHDTDVPGGESTVVEIDLTGKVDKKVAYVIEGALHSSNEELLVTVTPTCQVAASGRFQVEISNHGDANLHLEKGMQVAMAARVEEEELSTDKRKIASVVRKVFAVRPKEGKTAEKKQCLERLLEEHPALKKLKTVGKLSAGGKVRLAQILERYQECFAATDDFLKTPAKVPPLKVIPKPGAVPKFQRPYFLPQSKKAEVKRFIEDLKDKNVITPGISSWGSPLVLVAKKDGTTRVCVDLRHPNGQVVPSYSNLPNWEYVIGTQLTNKNARYLSALDLGHFYHQIPLDDPQGVLNISSHLGSFAFKRVVMGYVSSSAYVQSLMLTLLSDVVDECLVILIDDLLLHSEDEDSHLDLLELVLSRLASVGFVLKPSKCELMVREVNYLGFKIDGCNGKLHMEDAKVSKVKNWPRPRTVREVRAFVAFCSYIRRFIPGFAKLAKPLNDLTKLQGGSVVENWTEVVEESFQALKKEIVSYPTLRLPDPDKKYSIFCDASEKSLGFVVMQLAETPDGKKKLAPVAYGSRLVTETEARYSTSELEALGVNFALMKARYMVQGKDFTVFTDSDSVKRSLQSEQNKRSKRLTRFLIQIQDVLPASGKLDVQFIRGAINPADPLSRTNFGPNDAFDNHHVAKMAEVQALCAVLRSDKKADGRLKEIRSAQEKDPEMRQLRSQLAKKDVFRRGKKLAVRDGVVVALKEDDKEGFRYLLPAGLARELVRQRHYDNKESHPSEGEMVTYFSQHFIIPKLTEIANEVARSCDVCQRTRLTKQHFVADLTSIPRASKPMSFLSLDVAGPYIGYGTTEKYILVLIDNFSRYIWCETVGKQTGKAIGSFLTRIFGQFGHPDHLLTDRGTNLKFGIVPSLMEQMGVKKLESTAYHPASNGLVERSIGTISRALKRMVLAEKNYGKWPELLQVATNAYNRRIHSSTGYAPAEVLMSYIPETKKEPVPARVPITQPHAEYVKDQMERREKILQEVNDNLEEVEKKRKETFDRTRARPHDFLVGVWVLVRAGASVGKLAVPYVGPARIDEVDEHTATITYISNGMKEKVNIERLKQYYTSEPLLVKNFTAPKRNVGLKLQEGEETVEEGLQEENVLDEPVVTFE